MFKTLYSKLIFISVVTTFAVLISLPRIPIHVDSQLLALNSQIGGYYYNFSDGKFVIDLRELKRGLDLKGGIRVTLLADLTNIEDSEKDNALESAKEIISKRVDLLGVAEPHITTVKTKIDSRIVVEIPGVKNATEAVNLIGQTAQLTYKVLAEDVEWSEERYQEYFENPEVWVESGITGADMKGADVIVDQSGSLETQGKPQIQLRFSNEGREKFSELAKNNINKPIALFLTESDYPISMPIVSPDLAEGLFADPVISGNFDFNGANALSILIRAGALPVPVEVMEQEVIGATLGEKDVNKSFFAGAVGLMLVFTFMVFRYKKYGLLAGVSLIIYSVIVLAIFKIIPVVLTLPGIAGFILSIGMATDANILIFERVNEELYWGKSEEDAVHLGFDRAWNSIRDSNISSLITSFILFQFGTGPVKGFALTLAIGILVSLFTSIFIVKTLIHIMSDKEALT